MKTTDAIKLLQDSLAKNGDLDLSTYDWTGRLIDPKQIKTQEVKGKVFSIQFTS